MKEIEALDYISDYKVLVRCFTYNQSEYITDTLNGFAMQQTNFPFVCFVMDDASTDGEQQVIENFLEVECDMSHAKLLEDEIVRVVIVPHKTNKECTFAVYFLKENLYKKKEKKWSYTIPWRDRCEYEALCEGDDYWTKPYKLQKQVDLMDANPDVTLCFHNAIVHFEEGAGNRFVKKRDMDGNPIDYLVKEDMEDRFYNFEQTYNHWFHATASWLVRKEVHYTELYKEMSKVPTPNGDDKLRYTCAKLGRLYSFAEPMSVYRINQGGISQSFEGKYDIDYIGRLHFNKILDVEPQVFTSFYNEYKEKIFSSIIVVLRRLPSWELHYQSLKSIFKYDKKFIIMRLLSFPFNYVTYSIKKRLL